MARVPLFPGYPKKSHKHSGQARLKFRGKTYYLGKFGSSESRAEYARLAALFATAPEELTRPKADAVSIARLVAMWTENAKREYGERKETDAILRACVVMDRLYGTTRADGFGARELGVVRDAMANGSWMRPDELADFRRRKLPIGWCRNTCNHMTVRLRSVFRWAEFQQLVPRGTYEHLRSLPPLKKGRVRETPRRRPVEDAVFLATLPHCSAMVRAMAEVQWFTGMRPSELCRMTANKINRDGPDGTWLYCLDEYKSDHIEGAAEWQFVVLGPEAQRALAPWLDAAAALAPDAAIWRPRAGVPTPYGIGGYYQAIQDACERGGVQRWSPYQIRHSVKRRIVRLAGSDAARAVLRQKTLDATEQYAAQQDVETAAKIMKDAGVGDLQLTMN